MDVMVPSVRIECSCNISILECGDDIHMRLLGNTIAPQVSQISKTMKVLFEVAGYAGFKRI